MKNATFGLLDPPNGAPSRSYKSLDAFWQLGRPLAASHGWLARRLLINLSISSTHSLSGIRILTAHPTVF